jgi:hypothetical protein
MRKSLPLDLAQDESRGREHTAPPCPQQPITSEATLPSSDVRHAASHDGHEEYVGIER